MWSLTPDVSFRWRLTVVGLFAGWLVLHLIPGGLAAWVSLVLGLLIIPLFGLLGIDAALRNPREHVPLSAIESVAIGIALLAVANYVYLNSWWVRRELRPVWLWSVLLASALVIVPPVGLHLWGQLKGHEQTATVSVVSHLDAIVLTEGEAPSFEGDRNGWGIKLWGAHVEGDQIEWGASGEPPEVGSGNADRVVLLAVDGNEPRNPERARLAGMEVRRWLALADEVSSPGTPTYALLDTPGPGRRATWERALDPSDPDARRGGVFDLAQPGGARDLTDVALTVAVEDPSGQQDLELAARYRPLLFFDQGERYATPLNVDEIIRHGLFGQCFGRRALPGLCPKFNAPSEIDSAAKIFAFDPKELVDLGERESEDPRADRTTIYVHVSRAGNDRLNGVYLDYWWYLPDNPAGAGGGGLCGPGFVIPDKTCFDHLSDWEGITVVLDADAPPDAPPVAVGYAEHDGVTRYAWSALRRLWEEDGDLKEFGVDEEPNRPLVFVARGTHAAYPRSCKRARDRDCRAGGVPGVKFTGDLTDKPHDGGKPWRGNDKDNCRTLCLLALPTQKGSRPALWNSFGGRWGGSNCVLGIVFCSESQPPESPGAQKRYTKPWCRSSEIVLTGENYAPRKGKCADPVPSPDQIRNSEQLLALGDSYSSGEGAGDYDERTDRRSNTCHRSRWSWPTQLAIRMHLNARPSLACSGALTTDVTEGRNGGHEPERTMSQIGRIARGVNVITLTIGGNDVAFKGVLGTCIFHNCVRAFRKPSGDVLDARIDALRTRLPGVYAAIRKRAGGARLIVSGYPRLFAADPGPQPAGNCAAGERISVAEAVYLNEKTLRLDHAVADAAREAGVDFVDVYDAFDGHELRCGTRGYLNPLVATVKNLVESFHPTREGYARLAAVVARQLRNAPEQVAAG